MQLQDVLYTQGFGTRRACVGLIEQGAVAVAGATCLEPAQEFAAQGLVFAVRGHPWTWCAKAYLMMHKPAGTECSHKPGAWPSVYSLLPAPLRLRPNQGSVPGVQAVGRLDQDSTGLLLLTDDGALIHRLNSPRRHVPKVYEVTTVEAVDARQVERLLAGVVLNDDSTPVRAAACEASATHGLRLTLTEGKYHQVKRMVVAAGNQVATLHRSEIGSLRLPASLAPGEYRWLSDEEVGALREGR
ncbi:MAG: 16S rRNA pseudouridine(516) synthase [Nevskiales bacterium]